jgi:nitrogen fixation protein FixH
MTNRTAATAATARPFTGWHMLAILVAFFGAVMAVNAWMAYEAVNTWTGLEVENSYVASQEFNAKLKIAHERDALGWKGSLDYAGGSLVFSLKDGAGAPIPAKAVQVEVHRPIGMKGDRTLALSPRLDGAYTVPIALDPGVWIAAIKVAFAGKPDYEHHARLVVGGVVEANPRVVNRLMSK